jgi:hypothetical protein
MVLGGGSLVSRRAARFTLLKERALMPRVRPGTKVIAHKVGQRKAFKGKIVEARGKPLNKYYYVADAEGQLWVRAWNEITLLPRR